MEHGRCVVEYQSKRESFLFYICLFVSLFVWTKTEYLIKETEIKNSRKNEFYTFLVFPTFLPWNQFVFPYIPYDEKLKGIKLFMMREECALYLLWYVCDVWNCMNCEETFRLSHFHFSDSCSSEILIEEMKNKQDKADVEWIFIFGFFFFEYVLEVSRCKTSGEIACCIVYVV